MKKPRVLLAVLMLFTLITARAQSVPPAGFAEGYSAVDDAWRFHIGDDPAWASPQFDDSHWSLLRLDKSWAEQGYHNDAGFAWYRLRVRLPADNRPLALLLDPPATAVEIYVDGRLIRTIGQMRPAPVLRGVDPGPHVVPLPTVSSGRPMELALRVWESSLYASATGAGAVPLPRIGTVAAITRLHSLELRRYLDAQLPEILLDAVAVVIGLFGLGLFLLRARATEYLWCALWMFSEAAYSLLHLARGYLHWPIPPMALFFSCILAFGGACWLLFIWRFVGSAFDWKLKSGVALNLLTPLSILLVIYGVLTIPATYIASGFTTLAVGILIFVYLLGRVFRGSRDAEMLLPPFLLYSGMNVIRDSREALYFLGWASTLHLVAYRTSAFFVTWEDIFDLLAYLAVAGVLAMRFTHSAQEEQRLSTELQSAHQVQLQLVPARLESTAQLSFDAFYQAASEVGGDFYQVLPQSDGSMLVAVGDVSGKGLKAAMIGVLVVGALRSLAHENLSPARLLSRLNLLLADSSEGGFVTCLLLRIWPSGLVQASNAGHLAPYRAGDEVPIDSGLPLGVLAGSEYAESTFALTPGQSLTLLSDGIPEAQDRTGELFGFDRTREISSEPASVIARVARSFGQQDDITILKIAFSAGLTEADGTIPDRGAVTPAPLLRGFNAAPFSGE